MDLTCRFLSREAAHKTRGALRHTSRRAARHLSGVALLALAACSSGGTGAPGTAANGGPATGARNVGLLLPLSGANGALGNEMVVAAKLALAKQSGTVAPPQVDVHDTSGATGTTGAMQAAIAAGDGIVLGPLTSADTGLIAPQAIQAGVPVVAFTSDLAQARSGVWVFGITPQQQVARLVEAARIEGRRQFAAFLPDTPLGRAMGDALIRSCQNMGLATPQVVYHQTSSEAIRSELATLSAYDSRSATASGQATGPAPDLPADLAAALSSASKASTAADAQSPTDPKAVPPPSTSAASPASTSTTTTPTLSAPPFDALLLGDTGLALKDVIDALKANQVRSTQVRLMGPGLWAAFAGKLGGIAGAWYAAPDPAARTAFVQQFAAQNHRVPKPLADLAYDAGTLAGSVYAASGGNGYPTDIMTRKEGFSGVDGAFTLSEDGRTIRKLGIFEIQSGGGTRIITTPVPKNPLVPGSS
ncbi:penicillin-binding protein activator [Acetobacter conturbans]|uniref:Penicillin-binding protein activator n=1 Tax=Acetobacter conturbans TaxID=1737472 RepID=A0ABX0JYY1_9PROT|nr:penicillin-binding protein activator [Acetobacter conturbans]NHN88553.1 penicillin-binding protein activator [Acetobacter conturbans]